MTDLQTGQRVQLPDGLTGVVGWIDHSRNTVGVVVTGPSGQVVEQFDLAALALLPAPPPWRCRQCRREQPGGHSRYRVVIDDGEAELPVCYDCLVNTQHANRERSVLVGLVTP